MSNDGPLGMERLEDLEQHIESILRRRTPMVDSRTIGIIASKRNFSVEKETLLMERCKTSKCFCKHWTGTNPCYYRNCRHGANHFGGADLS
jgi:hypothetical protein